MTERTMKSELNLFPAGLAVIDFDGIKIQMLDFSESYANIFGYSADEYQKLIENEYGLRVTLASDFKKIYHEFIAKFNSCNEFELEYIANDKNELQKTIKMLLKVGERRGVGGKIYVNALDMSAHHIDNTDADIYTELYTVADIAADTIFEYDVDSGVMRFKEFKDGTLSVTTVYKNFSEEYRTSKYIHDEDLETFDKMCGALSYGAESVTAELRIFNTVVDKFEWHKYQGRFISDNKGNRIIGRIRNINNNKESELKLISKAERDPLTKIYNKMTTVSLIKSYLRNDSRDNLDALIIIDVDNFKHVNDNLGHLFGDSILIDLSQEMQDLFRSSDVVGRIGGDEFLVFLRGVKQKKHVEDKAADICRIFELLYSGENGYKITGSLGIALFPQDGDEYEDLFKKADTALYKSKGQGKNCFTFYEDCIEIIADQNEKAITNRYIKNVPILSYNNVFENEITDFAFDIMNKTKDVSSAIMMLLSKVGKKFKLSRVCIAEVIDQPFGMKYTYMWTGKNIESLLGSNIISTHEQWVKKLDSYDENDICIYNNIEMDEDEFNSYTYNFYKNSGTKALLECAIFDSGEYQGFVSFSDCVKPRTWTIDEVQALKTISKIVSSYLLKMRAYERAKQMVDKLTNYDNLTGLAKINLFREFVAEHLGNSKDGDKFAMVYFDFNNFKYINEKLGSETGDRILVSFSEGIMRINNNTLCATRVYSDKYILFLKIMPDEDITEFVIRFIDVFTSKEHFRNPDCQINLSCGIYVIEDPKNCDINIAIDNANIARKQAKLVQANNCLMYRTEMKQELNDLLEIVNQAEQAIQNREFCVYYQPKYSIATGEIVGAEALIRWIKPNGTIITPNSFIPHLEKSTYIEVVDFFVYEEVCRFLREELDDGDKNILPISVNVSRIHLKNPDFINQLVKLVSKYNIPVELLEFELTESAFVDDHNLVITTINKMRELGFRVSIDDFGTGFSSLNLLKDLPVDVLKLDKGFFDGGTVMKNEGIVISSIIEMAKKMDIGVLCEGVETEGQVMFLKDTKCDYAQGYYYARPLNQKDFCELKNK